MADACPTLLDQLHRDHQIMIGYLHMRVASRDWHGVRDAATDIEVIEGKMQTLGWKR